MTMGNPSERSEGAAVLPRNRLPAPPRTPSFPAGERRVSGTVPKYAATANSATAPEAAPKPPQTLAPSPALPAEGFRAEEPVSFDKRLTPVVPALWPEPVTARANLAPISVSPASQPGPAISVSPAPASSEHPFWDTPPAYSMPPADLVSQRPLPKPSRARALLTKLVFMLILCAVAMLLCYEISVAYHLPWLDPRLLAGRLLSG